MVWANCDLLWKRCQRFEGAADASFVATNRSAGNDDSGICEQFDDAVHIPFVECLDEDTKLFEVRRIHAVWQSMELGFSLRNIK
jgi:hypothetical protein